MKDKFPINTTHKIIQSGRSISNQVNSLGQNLLEEHPSLLLDGEQFTRWAALDEAIHRVIEKFNLGVEASFVLGGMEKQAEICTRSGLEKMHQKYSSWLSHKVKALILAECEFLAFNLFPEGEYARLFTFEKWGTIFENGEETWSQGEVDLYTLFFEDGRWKVDNVEFFSREA